jgi:hypothetical protein
MNTTQMYIVLDETGFDLIGEARFLPEIAEDIDYIECTSTFTPIRQWYLAYFDDDMGEEISEDASFEGLHEALQQGIDVYSYLDVCDSVIRERVFSGLSQFLDVDYKHVYELWLSPFI